MQWVPPSQKTRVDGSIEPSYCLPSPYPDQPDQTPDLR